MGLATIGILMCHASSYDVHLSPIIMSILSLGQIGVNLFFFLSGFGLYYSLSSQRYSLRKWYKRRYVRILVPYLLIYAPALIILCTKNRIDWWYFFYNISTVAYWFGYGGCWFICILIPLYFITPYYKRLIDGTRYKLILTLSISTVLYLFPIITKCLTYIGFSSAIFFFLGMYIARKAIIDCVLNAKALISLLIVTFIAFILYKYYAIIPLFWIIFFPILFFSCKLLDILHQKWIYIILNSLGNISLESYLFNTTLIIWIDSFSLLPDSIYYNYRYIIIVISGLILSYIAKYFNNKIIQKL